MRFEELTVKYEEVTVAEKLSLTLPDRSMTCFFAPSGTGKTTLLLTICGLLKPTGGRVVGAEGKEFAFVFQEDRLIEGLSATDNIKVVLDRENEPLAKEYLSAVGLTGWETALPDELSGGMKRRVAIARALAFGKQHEGRTVYLLDEPLKGLDEDTACLVMELIREKTKGEQSFLVTHDMEQAKRLADLIVCFDGRPMRVKEIIENKKESR